MHARSSSFGLSATTEKKNIRREHEEGGGATTTMSVSVSPSTNQPTNQPTSHACYCCCWCWCCCGFDLSLLVHLSCVAARTRTRLLVNKFCSPAPSTSHRSDCAPTTRAGFGCCVWPVYCSKPQCCYDLQFDHFLPCRQSHAKSNPIQPDPIRALFGLTIVLFIPQGGWLVLRGAFVAWCGVVWCGGCLASTQN